MISVHTEKGKTMSDKTGNLWLHTGFANSGRYAGTGIEEDDYSETSGCRNYDRWERVRFPNDGVKPEELSGECVIVQKGKKL